VDDAGGRPSLPTHPSTTAPGRAGQRKSSDLLTDGRVSACLVRRPSESATGQCQPPLIDGRWRVGGIGEPEGKGIPFASSGLTLLGQLAHPTRESMVARGRL
jgi:hypothetical protein